MAQNKALSLGGLGSPCCCTGVTGCILIVDTTWCTCVIPGTITVTVKDHLGVTVCTGTANGAGQFSCLIATTGTYMATASTSSSGYMNLAGSVTITNVSGANCVPTTVFTPIFPVQLTASAWWGAATLFPMVATNCAIGGPSPFAYTGTINFAFGGACGCAAATVPILIGVSVCNSGPAQVSACFPVPSFGGCPNAAGPAMQPVADLPIGTAMLQGSCIPVNLSGTVAQTTPIGLNGWTTLMGICTGFGTYSYSMTVTQ